MTPIDFAEANAFVALFHRHHKPMPGCKFCVAVSDELGVVRGVAMVGRPVARRIDDGWTLEVGQATTKPGQGWNVPTRPRVDTHPLQQKLKWEMTA